MLELLVFVSGVIVGVVGLICFAMVCDKGDF